MEIRWRKSSFSGGGGSVGGGNCVELAHLSPTTIAVRDSKAPQRGTIRFNTTEMAAWISTIQADNFHRD